MRLDAERASRLPLAVARPCYDRAAQQPGVVHFGIGAFHRAHQAAYFDAAMNAGERDWGIIGVSLRSPAVAAQLNPQDGLYTLATRSGDATEYRLIGAVQHVLVAPRERERVVAALAATTTRIATFTITEKGYCRTPDGDLDRALADDSSVYSLLGAGLSRRREAGGGGLTLLSCDNLAHNGAQLRRLFLLYLQENDPALADWVEANCTFPSSMVDRIVPAATAADRDAAEAAIGLCDEGHVVTEPFRQWVIEDRFAHQRPRFEEQGVEFVGDVAPYETAKLRMLNGAHSLLAYVGLARGHEFVHQAIADPVLNGLVGRLMREEAAPSIAAAPGQNLSAYADALVARFANPALNHRLDQIAMDGSQKLPQRWLETLAWHQRQQRQCPAILAGLAAWLRHVRGDARPVDDPMAERLAAIWSGAGRASVVDAMFGSGGALASDWVPKAGDRAAIEMEWEKSGR